MNKLLAKGILTGGTGIVLLGGLYLAAPILLLEAAHKTLKDSKPTPPPTNKV